MTFLARMLDIARANEPIDYSKEAKRQAGKDATAIAQHYVDTACINSDPAIMGATIYCTAYDALLAGGSVWVVRMNCGPVAQASELSNAAPVKPIKRQGRAKQ